MEKNNTPPSTDNHSEVAANSSQASNLGEKFAYIKNIISSFSEGELPNELQEWKFMTEIGILAGLVVGQVQGLRQWRLVKQQQKSRAATAITSNSTISFKSLLRFGVMGGVKCGLFVGTFSTIDIALRKYRNHEKPDFVSTLVAGTLTGGVVGATRGIKGIGSGTTLGAVLSAAFGLSLLLLDKTTRKLQTLEREQEATAVDAAPQEGTGKKETQHVVDERTSLDATISLFEIKLQQMNEVVEQQNRRAKK